MVDRSLRRLLEDQVIEVDRDALRRGVLVGASQQQHVLDETLHPQFLGQHHVGKLLGGGPLRMRQGNLGMLTDGGERRPQFVGCVGDKPALAVSTVFEPRQHAVHRRGESSDLVVGPRLRHPAV